MKGVIILEILKGIHESAGSQDLVGDSAIERGSDRITFQLIQHELSLEFD